jgi:hypothetical protein
MYYGRVYTQAFIRHLRERYPEGTRVELESLYDPCRTELRSGDKGTVASVDAQGTILIDLDCGISLGLIYEDDVFRIIK